MGWVRLDDKRALNRKLREAGFEARGLDEAALCLVAGDETDGFISDDSIAMLATAHSCRQPARLIAKLVQVGRWSRCDDQGGYIIHDYHDYNPTKAQLAELREKKREAGRAGGRRSSQARATAPATARGQPPATANGAASAVANAQARPQAPRAGPVPSPVVQSQSPSFTETHDGDPQAVENRDLDLDNPGKPPGTNGWHDPLIERLEAVCTGGNRPFVRLEAIDVCAWARTFADDRLIDESVGFFEQAATKPTLPRAVAKVIHDKAGDREIHSPTFHPVVR